MIRIRTIILYGLRAMGGFALAQWLTRKRLRILCYHGFSIGDEYSVAPYMFMRAETFEKRMKTLRRRAMPILDLGSAVKKLQEGKISNAETVITLDDGWSSNLTIGLPILKKYGFPACVYITTEHLTGAPEVFNVALTYMIKKSEVPSLELRGVHPEVDGSYPIRSDFHGAVVSLITAVERAASQPERIKFLAPVAKALNLNIEEVLNDGRFRLMTREQLIELYKNGLDIQLHTHTHRLPDTDFESMAAEIRSNQNAIQQLLGEEKKHFCYPSGKYDGKHPEWLQALGIASGTTCDIGHNPIGTPVLLLKRNLDWEDCSNIEFESEIAGVKECFRMLKAKLKSAANQNQQ